MQTFPPLARHGPTTDPRGRSRDSIPLIVSVDTEEDNWRAARDNITVENIRELPRLQSRLERLGARPTYFTTYQVANDQRAGAVIREIAQGGRAEIGGHLHPWNTPPLEEPLGGRMTMLKNLPARLQEAKLRTLTDTLERVVGRRPVAFRAGRWGLGPNTVGALAACGYRIDSSVTPFVSWEMYDDGPDHDGAPMRWYRLAAGGDVRVPSKEGPLLEMPASFGYTRAPFTFWHRLHETLASPRYRWTRLGGVADRTGLVRKVALSPETDRVDDMLRLAHRLLEDGAPYLHMFWHSPSLVPALSPFIHSAADVERFYASLEQFIERLAVAFPIRFTTISEAASLLAGEEVTPAGGSPRPSAARIETVV